jgi:hypothetical protein
VKGRERASALEVDPHVGVLLVQASKDVQNESTIVDDLTEIAKGVGHAFILRQ